VDAIVICVPTPLTENRQPDLGPLVDAATSLAGVLRKGQLVVLESTTYPGTTRERVVPLLEESGLAAGRDFNVAYSPERVDPGREDFMLSNTTKIVGGLTSDCAAAARSFYERVCDDVMVVSTPEAAELAKLLENIFRSVNIALVNELAVLCDRMDIDIWEVVDAAATKPFGFMRFDPGPGMGGHCLPSTRTCRTSASRRSSARSTIMAGPCATRASPCWGSLTSLASATRASPRR
jgi:UDP-N-acetyl-D-glucosamine dehydrogenase